VQEWKEDVKKAICSVAPVMDCILIRLWVFLFADKDVAQGRVPVRPISIPVIVFKKPGSKTPLVDTMVRRSSRLNPQAKDGFQIVKIKEPASKRRKMAALVIDLDQPPRMHKKLPTRSHSTTSASGVSNAESLLRSSRRMPLCKGALKIRINVAPSYLRWLPSYFVDQSFIYCRCLCWLFTLMLHLLYAVLVPRLPYSTLIFYG